jgi:transcription elongation factor Elf1
VTDHEPIIPKTFPTGLIVCGVCGQNWPCYVRQLEIAEEWRVDTEEEK